MAFAYLIRFSDDKAHRRAIRAFLGVREARQVFPERRMLVTKAHIAALRKKHIPFEYVVESPDGKKKTPSEHNATALSP